VKAIKACRGSGSSSRPHRFNPSNYALFQLTGRLFDPRDGLDFSQKKVSYSCWKLNCSGLGVALVEVETISNEDC
jgi:hypothetical protein